MALRILSFFYENVSWRIAQTPDGYFHREPSSTAEWLPGLPDGLSLEIVDSTFEQFSSTDHSLQPTNLSFKLTYKLGQSNEEYFIFSSPEGDTFSVRISPATFATLQEAFPTTILPPLRIANLVVHEAIRLGFPSVEFLPGTQLYQTIHSQISESFPG